jgi:hypothetical protein
MSLFGSVLLWLPQLRSILIPTFIRWIFHIVALFL